MTFSLKSVKLRFQTKIGEMIGLEEFITLPLGD